MKIQTVNIEHGRRTEVKMWPKETTCNSCEKDFSYEYEELKTYETIYEGGLTAVEFVFCPHCGAEVITHI
jgi:Zn finger protein HypA/HybF involved in hydrogenase expression